MKISDLMELRTAIVTRMKEADASDNTEQFAAAETELTALDGKIDRARKLADLERCMTGSPVSGGGNLTGEIRQRFSIARAIAGAAGMPGVDWGFEREVQSDLARRNGQAAKGVLIPTELFERRVITTAAPAAGPGSNIIPTDYLGGEYISALTASTVISGLGARTLTGLQGNVDIPGEKAAPAVAWVAENAAISASDAQFRTVSLTPKHVGSLSEFSRNMVLQTSPDIEALLRQMMARDIAVEIDRAAINGATNGPAGLLATVGVQNHTYTESLYDTVSDMITLADAASVGPSRRFLGSVNVKSLAMKSRSNTLAPLGIPWVFNSLNGVGPAPVFSSLVPDNLGAGNNEGGLILGDWSEMLIGVWSALDVLVNPYESTAYSKGNIAVRTMATVDVALRHPQAFVKTSIPATAVAIGNPAV